jgi:SAM-dependent methyltransferase
MSTPVPVVSMCASVIRNEPQAKSSCVASSLGEAIAVPHSQAMYGPDSPPQIFDRGLMRRRRIRALAGRGFPDFLCQAAVSEVAERLDLTLRSFELALALGAAAVPLARVLADSGKFGRVISADRTSPGSAGLIDLVFDEEALPFAPASLDAVIAVLGLESVNDLPGALVQIRRALKPDGLFLTVLFGGETLFELRQAWFAAEAELVGGVSPRVAPFADVRELGGVLQRAGFALPVADVDRLTVRYPSGFAVMAELKAMGLANALSSRSRRPVTAALLARAAAIYEKTFSDPDGKVRATFDLVTLTGWAPAEGQPQPLQPGSARVRLAEALGTTEHKLKR